jgi:hypothetical protein
MGLVGIATRPQPLEGSNVFALLRDPSVTHVFIDTSDHVTSAGDSTHRTHSAANQVLNDVTKGRFALR